MAYNSQENAVENTFVKAQDQINKLQKVFRDEGLLAKAVVDIGGNQDFGAIQKACDDLYGALEDAHYDAMAHIEVESVKQKLGMNEEPVAEIPTGDDVNEDDEEIQAIPSKVVELAGDSIWDRDGSNPKSVKVSKVSILDPYGGSDPYMADDEDDGYRKVDVEHDGPWSIYTDSGFEKAISKMVGFEVTFTEQGMQQDGMASMEGTMGEAMESVKEGRMGYRDADKLGRENASKIDNILRRKVADMGKDIRDVMPGDLDEMRYEIAKQLGLVESTITEGYEGKVLSILKKEGIGAYFSGGKLYIDQADMAEAKSALADNDDIKELPDMVAEAHKDDCGCDACAEDDKKMTADDELQLLLKRAGLR